MAGRRLWLLVAHAMLAVACGSDSGGDPSVEPDGTVENPARGLGSFAVRESVEQLHVTHAKVGQKLEVVNEKGDVVDRGMADDLGSIVFRKLAPGKGYTVRAEGSDPEESALDLEVMSVEGSLPKEAFYAAQELKPGFGYITTRDGTKLSAFVSLPGPLEDGPYPTVVNYSGYDPSQPGSPVSGAEGFCSTFPVLCNAPHDASSMIANLMGYASVSVNVRGTGCSGGAYDYFETLQVLDGYDVIETVARQKWVMHGKVGMVGLSYPGISQLFVAQSQPPHLAAITPMSVIADTTTSTLAPGGIFNEGFAFRWIENVLRGARPYGKGWEMDIVTDELARGDSSICEENQLLHGQAVDAIAKAKANPYYSDELAKPLDPSAFVNKINVPVFLSGQWQDEQTGPHFPALFDRFSGAPLVRFTVTNGVHPDGFAPQVLGEWKTFLDLYVARQHPSMDPAMRLIAPQLFSGVFEESLALPPDRFAEGLTYEEVLAAYEREPQLRVIFETGADRSLNKPGAPLGTFDVKFNDWPIEGTSARRLYFGPAGTLSENMPSAAGGTSSFQHDPEAGQRTTLAADVTSSDEVWKPQPRYDYRPLIAGKAAAFIGEPLSENLVAIGHGSVDLWMKSSAKDADLEVNITEVRADGKESYVQSGWLRASHRKLRADATELRPLHSYREEDAAPLPEGQWELVRVEVMPFAHIFRAGSRIRVSVDTPGDTRAAWKFILLDYDSAPTHTIAHDLTHPSSLVLPVISGVSVPTATPPCEALRGQPCRDYAAYVNMP